MKERLGLNCVALFRSLPLSAPSFHSRVSRQPFQVSNTDTSEVVVEGRFFLVMYTGMFFTSCNTVLKNSTGCLLELVLLVLRNAKPYGRY